VTVRLFAAVEVAPDVRTALESAIAPLRTRAPALKWTSPEQWHLTLAFLGWIAEDRVAAASAALASAARGVAPFDLALSGALGTFRSGVLWVEVTSSPALGALADATSAQLRATGFEVDERPFRAHLTLARARRGDRVPRGLGEGMVVPARGWRVERAVLFRSHLSRGAARYEAIASCALGAL
jgi:2'-5' RNA ligase